MKWSLGVLATSLVLAGCAAPTPIDSAEPVAEPAETVSDDPCITEVGDLYDDGVCDYSCSEWDGDCDAPCEAGDRGCFLTLRRGALLDHAIQLLDPPTTQDHAADHDGQPGDVFSTWRDDGGHVMIASDPTTGELRTISVGTKPNHEPITTRLADAGVCGSWCGLIGESVASFTDVLGTPSESFGSLHTWDDGTSSIAARCNQGDTCSNLQITFE